MNLTTFLKIILAVLGVLFIALEGLNFVFESAIVSTLALIILLLLFFKTQNKRMPFFTCFLLLFTASNALTSISFIEAVSTIDPNDNLYYICNILFIIAYLCLIVHIVKSINVRKVISEFRLTILVLFVLDLFCVIIVTNTTEGVLTFSEYSLELIYNVVIMSFLVIATLNYMYRSDYKSILFLIASVCIVFSEMIQLAYYYILDDRNLGFIYSFLLVAGFALFYIQSQKAYTGPQIISLEDYAESPVN